MIHEKLLAALSAMRISDIAAHRRFTMTAQPVGKYEIHSVTPAQIALLHLLEDLALENATPEQRTQYEADRVDWIRAAARGVVARPTDRGETQHAWVYTDGSWTCDACGYVVHCYRLPATLAHPCIPKTKEKP